MEINDLRGVTNRRRPSPSASEWEVVLPECYPTTITGRRKCGSTLSPVLDPSFLQPDECAAGPALYGQEALDMISDVLYEAVEEIRQYQQTFPETYDTLRKHLNALVTHMESVRSYLDTAHAPTVELWLRQIEQLSSAVETVDLTQGTFDRSACAVRSRPVP